jgi:hypothetical protein
MKRSVALLLALLFIFSTFSCAQQPISVSTSEVTTAAPSATATEVVSKEMPTDEFQRAIWYGFAPAELQTDLDKSVTFSEFSSMVSNMMASLNQEDVTKWQSEAADALKMTDTMQRDDAMIMLFLAADSIGQTALRNGWSGNWGDIQAQTSADNWNKFLNDYSSFISQWNYPFPGGWEESHIFNKEDAFNFSIGEKSLVSGNSLLDYDVEKNSMRPLDPFTRREAILAIARLYEALEFNIYVPVANAIPFSLTSDLLAKAEKMPAASNNSLPKWYGATMDNMSANWNDDSGMGILYWQQDVQNYAKMGINFLRVPLDSELIFKNNNLDQVNNAMLKNMDDLVAWGIENGVHICFDLHNTFGFNFILADNDATLFKDTDVQNSFVKFWSFMAQRYASVPNNAVSFDLLNEPRGDNLKEETYVSVMKQAIDAIRAATPDRLIFVDMFNVAHDPIESLVETGVAQSAHVYISGVSGLNPDGTPAVLKSTWPLYLINGFIDRNNGPVVINGDFKAGTIVTIRIDGIHKNGKIVVRGDGTELASYELGKEQVGENFCNSINEQGGGGENRWYNGAGFTFTLAQDVKKIDIRVTGESQWFYIGGISISNDSQSTLLISQGNVVTKSSTPSLTIATDGSVTASDPETLLVLDENYPTAQVKKYSDFSASTGIPVMVQEFGFDSSTDYSLVLHVLDAELSAFSKNNLNWCMWSSSFNFIAVKDEWKRKGATYEQIGDNRWVATEMLDAMKKYMQ